MSMKGCTHIYTLLGNYDNKLESEIAKKWSENLEIDIREECVRKSIKTSYNNTKDMYVRNIQFKIWHNLIATNRFLYQIGILDSLCICCKEEENIMHAFLLCQYIKRFWNEVETLARELVCDFVQIEDKYKVMGIE